MKNASMTKNFLARIMTMLFIGLSLIFVSCVADQGVAKGRGVVKDFSTSTNEVGCGAKFFLLSSGNTCATECASGTHVATGEELTVVYEELNTTPVTDAKTKMKKIIEASAGVCIDDVVIEKRPTNQVDIKSDFCSCLAGKPDIISDCQSFCASKTASNDAILYVNTIVGPEIALNTKLGNLSNWCSVQLESDTNTPQCTLTATSASNTITNIPVILTPGSNSFRANIASLSQGETWILKLVENGSKAQSKEFQLRRKVQTTTEEGTRGALKIRPISQYSCLTYSATETNGQINYKNYVRLFYYFQGDETPIIPPSSTSSSLVACHDIQKFPGADNIDYPRMELIPNAIAMWDRSDTRMVAPNGTGTKLVIESLLEQRLVNEYHYTTAPSISLFRLISYPNKPVTTSTSSASANIPLGFIMIPFSDPLTGRSYCPSATHYNGTAPLMNLLGEYLDDTEGLYLGEKEPENILQNGVSTNVYGTMFVRETTLLNYGFYIENGLRIKANLNSLHTKTIYYYWPTSSTADPLTAGGRKLYTVRYPDSLNGNSPTGVATSVPTTDKRIGCVPKS